MPPIPKADYYIYDHLGNTRVVYTPNIICATDPILGDPVVSYHIRSAVNYYPYGKVLWEYTPDFQSNRFLTTYHERDAESGLDYRGARF